MKTYKTELKSILLVLRGCAWAAHSGIQDVIAEYEHLRNAASTPTPSRRVSLQIFHASRAVDTFLAHLAGHECTKTGRTPPSYWTLTRSRNWIQNHKIGGMSFDAATEAAIRDITTARNTYMHNANFFPNDPEMQQFINRTARTISAAAKFPP